MLPEPSPEIVEIWLPVLAAVPSLEEGETGLQNRADLPKEILLERKVWFEHVDYLMVNRDKDSGVYGHAINKFQCFRVHATDLRHFPNRVPAAQVPKEDRALLAAGNANRFLMSNKLLSGKGRLLGYQERMASGVADMTKKEHVSFIAKMVLTKNCDALVGLRAAEALAPVLMAEAMDGG